MKMDYDYRKFISLLNKLSLNFKECDFTEKKTDLYWEFLKKYKINSVERGINYIINTKTFPTCPTIGEIIVSIEQANKTL